MTVAMVTVQAKNEPKATNCSATHLHLANTEASSIHDYAYYLGNSLSAADVQEHSPHPYVTRSLLYLNNTWLNITYLGSISSTFHQIPTGIKEWNVSDVSCILKHHSLGNHHHSPFFDPNHTNKQCTWMVIKGTITLLTVTLCKPSLPIVQEGKASHFDWTGKEFLPFPVAIPREIFLRFLPTEALHFLVFQGMMPSCKR